jgi:hypothetical protein
VSQESLPEADSIYILALEEHPLHFANMVPLVGIFTWIDARIVAAIITGVVIVVHIVPWLVDPHRIRSVPGPFFAKFSDVWLSWLAADGHRSEVIHQLHLKHGEPFTYCQRNLCANLFRYFCAHCT